MRRELLHTLVCESLARGCTRAQVAQQLNYSRSHINDVLLDPTGVRGRRRRWAKMTPLQRATSRLTPP